MPNDKPKYVLVPEDLEKLEMFDPLDGYPALPLLWAHKIYGKGDLHRFRTRLAEPLTEPWGLLGRKKQAMRHAIYYRTQKGDKALIDAGKLADFQPRPKEWLSHSLQVSMYEASLKIGADEHGLKMGLIDMPRSLTLSGVNAKGKPNVFEPDGRPLTLFYPNKSINIIKEIDNATETYERIEEKFRNYRNYYDNRLYEKYGLSKPYTVIQTIHEGKMHEYMKRAAKILGPHTPHFLFQTWVHHFSAHKFEEPSGVMLTKPYRRISLPDFSLVKGE